MLRIAGSTEVPVLTQVSLMLLMYALGRELDARDQPTVREIMRSTEANRYRFWDLIVAIVKSVPFQMRQTLEH